MKWFLTIFGIITLSAGLIVGFYEHYYVMLISFFAFIGLLITANLDRLKFFRATRSGVEAETREIIDEAKNTIAELQLLARNIGALTLSLVKRSGRFGGYDENEKESIKISVLDVLRKIGIPESEFPIILSDWNRFTEFDYAHAILGGSRIPEGVDNSTLMEWEALREGGIEKIPSPEILRAFIAKHNLMNQEIDEYLKDYEYFRAHKKHRRPEVWQKRQYWGHLKAS